MIKNKTKYDLNNRNLKEMLANKSEIIENFKIMHFEGY